MPEYLSPGVYVEEVPSTPTIEGVSTTVSGFIGPTRYGPITGDPELLTSYLDFSHIYCGVDQLNFKDADSQDNYLAHAVNAFFSNGGTMLYVTRVYNPAPADANGGKASYPPPGSLPASPLLMARFPGEAGNMQITFVVKTSPNLMVPSAPPNQTVPARVSGLSQNDLVYIKPGTSHTVSEGLYDVVTSNPLAFENPHTKQTIQLSSLDATTVRIYRITLTVLVLRNGQFEAAESWSDLSPNPQSRNSVTSIFTATPKSRDMQLTVPFAIVPPTDPFGGADVVKWLFGADFIETTLSLSLATDSELNPSLGQTRPSSAQLQTPPLILQGGSDGDLPTPDQYLGQPASRDPSGNYVPATGLETFADIDEISIIAAPGYSFNYNDNPGRANEIVQNLIEHCEIRMKYRVALLDSPDGFIVSEVQTFRGQFDSSYAALYYPWLKIIDPLDPDARREIIVPPSGYVAGICARSDDANGVSKAPANEVPIGAIDLELLLNKAQQDVLNPIGINCFRFFPDRGFRLWGARTISSDPDWKYLNVRRYFAYVEHSLDKGTQYVVFQKNNEVTWTSVTQTVSDFLYNEWRNNALMGTSPSQAFFVRCDRSTMTQNDLDNGRLICLVGIAVIKPAEFVIFRISQFTASAT
jgi:phage tail sheath protein FI